jgi:hypothetical protein
LAALAQIILFSETEISTRKLKEHFFYKGKLKNRLGEKKNWEIKSFWNYIIF